MLELARAALIACVALAGTLVAAQAADSSDGAAARKSMPVPPAPVAQPGIPTARGVVTKIDRQDTTITVDHHGLVTLNVPAGITTFGVRSAAMLDQIERGDAVDFVVERNDGRLTIVRLQRAR